MKTRRRAPGAGSVVKRPDTGVYSYIWVDEEGRKHRKSLNTRNRETALELAAGYVRAKDARDADDVLHESARLRKIIAASEPLPWDKVWRAFLATNPTGSPGTLHNYEQAVKELRSWCTAAHPGVSGLHQVTPEVAEGFLESVWQRGVSANRCNYIRGALLLVTSRLARKYGLNNPWAGTGRRDDPARKRQKRVALTAKQTADLLALVDNPDTPVRWRGDTCLLFRLGLFAGMREKDAALLRWADIDMDRRMIHYTPHKTRGKAIVAEVPMVPDVASEIIARWNRREDGQEYVLPDVAAEYQRTGKRGATTKAVEKQTVALIHKVTGDGRRERQDGDPQRKRIRSPYGFHSCRHTFCSVLAQRGVPLAKLAAMTGDAPNTLQAYYVHVEGEHHELNTAFAPLLPNGSGKPVASPRDRLQALVSKMTDAEAAKALELLTRSRGN